MSQERIILSFMGIGNLQETTYQLNEQRKRTQFFADALCTFYPGYQLKVVMTDEARAKHGSALSEVCDFERVDIPSGKDENELWEMFTVIAEHIPESSELIVDITHGFRSQPMLILAACVYLQTTKDVTVKQIVYGAYEAKDQAGVAPVFDLTSFLDLIAWSASARQFIRYGNAAPMRDLLKDIHTQTYKGQQGYKAKGLASVGDRLAAFGDALAMVRPKEVLQQAEDVPKAIEKARNDLENLIETQPFGMLLEQVNRRIEPYTHAHGELFTPEGLKAQAEMIGLYLETEQYQQALTLAREALVSKTCLLKNLDPIKDRKCAEDHLNKLKKKLGGDQNLKREERRLAQLWEKVSNLRNDINHAGMKANPTPAKTTIGNVKRECESVSKWLL